MKNIKIIIMLFIISLFITETATNNKDSKPKKETATQEQNFDEIIFNWSRTFAQAMDIAHKKHYKIDDVEESMIKAIDGFVSTLDAHSNLLDKKTYKEMLEMTSGEFFGIGIVIDNMRKKKDKHLTIIDTIPDGPADKAGILPMDKIIEINGQILEGLATEKIVTQIKGERHSVVSVKIMREGSPDLLSFDIARDVVKEQHSLCFHIKNHNISYLSLSMFTDVAVKQITELLKQSQQHNYKGLILDLRNNSGGLLTAAIDIAGLFLQKGSLVAITKNKNNEETDRYSTKRAPIIQNTLPIFILINNFTASAGEILAGALKIHSDTDNSYLAFLIGTQTFGKGSVQEVIPISNNCAIKITTHLYFLPDNTTIQGSGINPDFYIERTSPPTEQALWFTKHYGHENTLDHYIKVPQTNNQEAQDPADEKKSSDPKAFSKKSNRRYDKAKEMLQKDNQLKDCITLINMLHTAQRYTPDLVQTRQQALSYLKSNFVCNDALDIEEIKI